MRFVIVGAGIYGCVMAERIATVFKEPVLLIDRRSHIGGNCWSEREAETGIECHRYGSHIFHTSNRQVWDYLNRFTGFNSYRHKVLTKHKGGIYSLPINLFTINKLYGEELTPAQAKGRIANEIAAEGIGEPQNLEEKAISLIGRKLYRAFIENYTAKQWAKAPADLPEQIITRLPVRFSYNMDYFNDPWQGIPLSGYGELFRKIVANKNITLKLNTDWQAIRNQTGAACQIIYTGMVDELFAYKFGPLEWRSLQFEWQVKNEQDHQGAAVMNYADIEPKFTRIHEFKHYHPERQQSYALNKTVICREYPDSYQPGKDAYYPINSKANNALYERYAMEAKKQGVILGGRLGCYRYWDMDKAIENALQQFASLEQGFSKAA